MPSTILSRSWDQRAELRELLASVDKTDHAIAIATGFGDEAPEMAKALKLKPAAVRKRLQRLRSRSAKDRG
jgi:predicted ArsR family transcriptional regulator